MFVLEDSAKRVEGGFGESDVLLEVPCFFVFLGIDAEGLGESQLEDCEAVGVGIEDIDEDDFRFTGEVCAGHVVGSGSVDDGDVEGPFDGLEFGGEVAFIDEVDGGVEDFAVFAEAFLGVDFDLRGCWADEDGSSDVLLVDW